MYFGAYNIVYLLISAAVAYYLYTDAKKTGRNEVIWGVLGFFFSLAALIVYFVTKEARENTI